MNHPNESEPQSLENPKARDVGNDPGKSEFSPAAEKTNESEKKSEKSFEELSNEANVGLIQEFVDFLRYNKKWWLTPIIIVLLLVGVLIFLTTSGAAPFLYTFW